MKTDRTLLRELYDFSLLLQKSEYFWLEVRTEGHHVFEAAFCTAARSR